MPKAWEQLDLGAAAVTCVVLSAFVLVRIYQLLRHNKRLRREVLRGSYAGQAIVALLLACVALILWKPDVVRVVGLLPSDLNLGPKTDDGVAPVVSSGPRPPRIAYIGALAPA